jgi:hypothetical protein
MRAAPATPVAEASALWSDSLARFHKTSGRNSMRKELALLAAIAALFALTTFGAQAMPAAPLSGASKAQVIQVRDGCGPHRWRGPHGRCHWDRGWRH